MTESELKLLKNQLSTLSYEEQLSVMEILIKLLKKNYQETASSKHQSEVDKKIRFEHGVYS